MIDQFRVSYGCCSVVAGQLLDLRPIRQEPRLEVELCRVRVKSWFIGHPMPHLGLSVRRISKDRRNLSSVNIGQGDHMVRWISP